MSSDVKKGKEKEKKKMKHRFNFFILKKLVRTGFWIFKYFVNGRFREAETKKKKNTALFFYF